jgi:hypothetical protein
MSGHASTIWTAIKTAIADNIALGNSVIFKREELVSDELDRSKVNIFITQESEKIDSIPYVADFRNYRVRVTLRFEVDGRSLDDVTDDDVVELKSTYNDALQTAIRTTMVGQANVPQNVYSVVYVSTDWNYGEQGKPYDESHARVYRISQTWDYFTYES